MKPSLLISLLPLIDATTYRVEVISADGLKVLDDSTWFTTGANDPYVEIYAYGEDGCVDSLKTSIKSNDASPTWNEGFVFSEETCDCDDIEKLVFKLWDDDSTFGLSGVYWTEPDFLGDTDAYYVRDISRCDQVYELELDVSLGGELVLEVSKDCALDTYSTSDSEDSDSDDSDSDDYAEGYKKSDDTYESLEEKVEQELKSLEQKLEEDSKESEYEEIEEKVEDKLDEYKEDEKEEETKEKGSGKGKRLLLQE